MSFQFTGPSISAPEGEGILCGGVRRTGSLDGSYTLTWRIIPFTAQVNEDFAGPLMGTLTVPAGQVITCLQVQILNDGAIEPTESFTLQLVSASGQATIGSASNFVFEIRDYDRGIEFAATEFTVMETATQAVVKVHRGDDGSAPLTVRYETFVATATPGLDYEPQSGTLTFPQGLADATFQIPIRDDCLLETNEFIGLRLLSSAGGAVVGSLSNALLRIVDAGLERPGSRDLRFNPLTRGAEVLATRADGRILVGGNILGTMPVPQPLVMQLLPDGSADPSFNPLLFSETLLGSYNTEISAMAVDAAGRVVVAGFQMVGVSGVGYVSSNFLTRLLPNGAVDPTFHVDVQGRAGSRSAAILAMAVQADDRILIGGDVQSIDGAVITGLVRLLSDGSYDFGFTPTSLSNVEPMAVTWLTSVHVMADGRIVIGGSFTHVQGVRREGVARLRANGSLDPTFDSSCALCDVVAPTLRTIVESLAVDARGNVWVAGSFTNIGMEASHGLARLLSTGAIDRSVSVGSGASNGLGLPPYRHVALQWDGKVLVSGLFTNFSGVAADGLVRLNPDGSVDRTFQTGIGQWSNALLVQPDGHILLSHDVSYNTRLIGEPVLVSYVARLYGEPALILNALMDPIFLAPQIQFSTRPGATYRLEQSVDLRHWLPVATNLATECSIDFYPSIAESSFYRAVRLGW